MVSRSAITLWCLQAWPELTCGPQTRQRLSRGRMDLRARSESGALSVFEATVYPPCAAQQVGVLSGVSPRRLFKARSRSGGAAGCDQGPGGVEDVGSAGGSERVTILAEFDVLIGYLGAGESVIVPVEPKESENSRIVAFSEMLPRAQAGAATLEWRRPNTGGSWSLYQLAAMNEHVHVGNGSHGISGWTLAENHLLQIPNAFYAVGFPSSVVVMPEHRSLSDQ